MDKYQALHTFWSGFDVPAYDQSSVPKDATFPRLTYSVSTSDIVSGPVSMTASLWYYGESWADISRKTDQIASQIGMGGTVCLYDNGALWVKRGSNFSQRMSDPEDINIRRVVLQIEAEFLSAN